MVKNLPAKQETGLLSLDPEDLLEEVMATHSSMLPWRIPGQRSLVGYSPWGRKESDMTEKTENAGRRIRRLSCCRGKRPECILNSTQLK